MLFVGCLGLGPNHGKRSPPIDAEQDDEHGLDCVYDENERQGEVALHAVKDEHRLHRKMPWTGTVGRGNYHGYASHHECHKSTTCPKG